MASSVQIRAVRPLRPTQTARGPATSRAGRGARAECPVSGPLHGRWFISALRRRHLARRFPACRSAPVRLRHGIRLQRRRRRARPPGSLFSGWVAVPMPGGGRAHGSRHAGGGLRSCGHIPARASGFGAAVWSLDAGASPHAEALPASLRCNPASFRASPRRSPCPRSTSWIYSSAGARRTALVRLRRSMRRGPCSARATDELDTVQGCLVGLHERVDRRGAKKRESALRLRQPLGRWSRLARPSSRRRPPGPAGAPGRIWCIRGGQAVPGGGVARCAGADRHPLGASTRRRSFEVSQRHGWVDALVGAPRRPRRFPGAWIGFCWLGTSMQIDWSLDASSNEAAEAPELLRCLGRCWGRSKRVILR